MLSFKEDSAIKLYEAQVEDPEKAQEILKEVLETEKRKTTEEYDSIYTNYDRGFKKFRVNITDNGLETIYYSPSHPASYAEYTLGSIETTAITFSAPYTLALASENFSFGPYKYASMLSKTQRSNEIDRVINNANIDELAQLLACFDNNPDALEVFLKTHYPDLLYLRRYLECIKLEQTDEISLENSSNHSLRVIQRAISNSDIAQKLRLDFKGRSR